jgi:hypothetical protein
MKKLFGFFLLVFILFIPQSLFSVQKGSQSAVSIELAATFPAEDSDNKMLAFGMFKNGFILEDSTTTCTFESIFPVCGTIDFNGGTLYLDSDLHFQNSVVLSTLGHIYGNYHLIEFASQVNSLSDSTYDAFFEDSDLFFNCDMTVSSTLRFNGDCSIDGGRRRLIFDDDGHIFVERGSTLTFRNIHLEGISAEKISGIDNSSKIVLENVGWNQDGNYTFSVGSLQFIGNVDFFGTYTFHYDSSLTSTIAANSEWKIHGDLRLMMGKKFGDSNIQPLYMQDSSSILMLDHCTLQVTSSGMQFTRGSIFCDRDVEVDIDCTCSNYGLFIGDGAQAGDIIFAFFPGSIVYFPGGALVFNITNPDIFKFRDCYAKLVRRNSSIFYLYKDLELSHLGLDVDNYAQLVVSDGVNLDYDTCDIIYPAVNFSLSGRRVNPYSNILKGNNKITLEYGNLPAITYVSGSRNSIEGTGDISGNIILQDSSTELTLAFDGLLLESVTMNGGKVILSRNTDLILDSTFSGSGTVDLSVYKLNLGTQDLSWTSSIYWDGNNARLALNSKTSLSSTWTFSGNCVLEGYGQELVLKDTANIIVERGSTLRFKGISIENISGTKIRCLDDSGKIILDNIQAQFDGDYSLSVGQFEIMNNVDLSGTSTCNYYSNNPVYVHSCSELRVKDGLTLNLDNQNTEALIFTDNTSVFRLFNANFNIGSYGQVFSKGKMIIDGAVNVSVNSTSTSNAVFLGNGVEEEDLTLIFNAASSLNMVKGHIVYDIVNPSKLISMSNTAKIFRGARSNFYLKQDINFANVTFEVETGAVINMADSKTMNYKNCDTIISGVRFLTTGSRYNSYTTLLSGGDSVFISEGIFPMYLLVMNTGNVLRGSGCMSGGIILAHSATELTLILAGNFSNNITMNDGSLVLGQDFHITDDNMLVGNGSVDLSNNSLYLGSKDKDWTGSIYWDGDIGHIHLNSKISLSNTWTISGNCIINGNNNELYLEDKGNIIVERGSILTLKNILLSGLSEYQLRCMDNSGVIILDNSTLMLDGNYTVSLGSAEFINKVDISGTGTFCYYSNKSSLIHKNSILTVCDGMTFRIGDYTNQPLTFYNVTSKLKQENSNFYIGELGVLITKGTTIHDGTVNIEMDSTSTANGLQFGDGTVENDLTVLFNPSSVLNIRNGHVLYNITDANKFNSRSTYAKIVRYAPSYFYINQDVVFDNLIFDVDNNSVMDVADGKTVSYQNCESVFNGGKFKTNGSRYNSYTNLLAGSDSIFVSEGTLPMYAYVMSTGNMIYGSGSYSGGIILNDSNTELIFDLDGVLSNNVTMNNGSIVLNSDLQIIEDNMFVGNGSIDLAGNCLYLGAKDKDWTGSIYWDGNFGSVCLNSKISLSNTWTISGNCTINGQGVLLDLQKDGNIIVERGSTLKLKNIEIHGISGYNIRCLDDNAKIILDNVNWVQDADYTFSIGQLEILKSVDFTGSYTFFYSSSKTVTVNANSSWNFLECTKIYLNTSTNIPVWFTNKTSRFCLQNSTCEVGSAGWYATRGGFDLRGRVDLEFNSTSTANGLILGNGTSSGDVEYLCHPGSDIHLHAGHFTYDLTTPNGFNSMSASAKVIRYAGNHMYVKKTLLLDNIIVELDLASTLDVADEEEVKYSNCKIILPMVKYLTTSGRYNAVTALLDGDDEIFMHEGVLPLYLLIQNDGNTIRGNGSFSGGIILQDSDAELTFDLDGKLLNNVTLNNSKIILSNDLDFGSGVHFLGGGIIDLNANRVSFGSQDLNYTCTMYWDGDGGQLELNSTVGLYGTWTFSGDCKIKGNYNIIDLSMGGNIVVECGSTLTLEDIRIKGLSGTNIQCADDAGIINFNETKCWLTNNYNFEKGKFNVIGNVEMHGAYTFSYQSSQQSSISVGSSFYVKPDSIFSYAPCVAQKGLISLPNSSSKIILDSATLHSTTTGLQLTKGTLEVEGTCYLSSDATYRAEGIVFGDGISEANDLNVDINPESSLELQSGYLVNKNLS